MTDEVSVWLSNFLSKKEHTEARGVADEHASIAEHHEDGEETDQYDGGCPPALPDTPVKACEAMDEDDDNVSFDCDEQSEGYNLLKIQLKLVESPYFWILCHVAAFFVASTALAIVLGSYNRHWHWNALMKNSLAKRVHDISVTADHIVRRVQKEMVEAMTTE